VHDFGTGAVDDDDRHVISVPSRIASKSGGSRRAVARSDAVAFAI
jgi:hypothetical protein